MKSRIKPCNVLFWRICLQNTICACIFIVELGANIAGGVGGRGEREEESTSGVSTFNSQHSHPEEVHRFIERLESRDSVYTQLKQLEDENRR